MNNTMQTRNLPGFNIAKQRYETHEAKIRNDKEMKSEAVERGEERYRKRVDKKKQTDRRVRRGRSLWLMERRWRMPGERRRERDGRTKGIGASGKERLTERNLVCERGEINETDLERAGDGNRKSAAGLYGRSLID